MSETLCSKVDMALEPQLEEKDFIRGQQEADIWAKQHPRDLQNDWKQPWRIKVLFLQKWIKDKCWPG